MGEKKRNGGKMKRLTLVLSIIFSTILVGGIVHSETVRKILVECTECKGSGTVEKEVKCDICNSSGQVSCTTCSGSGRERCNLCNGTHQVKVKCRECYGTGSKNGVKCEECAGEGTVFETCESCESDGKNVCHTCDGKKTVDCSFCGGKGYNTLIRTCTKCGGDGKVEE
ncbi:MAG: hypothetical protein COX65_03990 [Elusimicrobia bacterium CG_4_10_14_0_2_um_filter_56_8]|nr:MAG: hypothetical protein AUJ51_01590 [Elusimicrobia bacterium CG1_02_56_21]PJA15558.1 MAG: hypothetical protein COX65_03990 [Elusimicrobia bacterium CG_4_10_14_0_2_um_filter_56_8]